jgi:hypothetical protein
MEKERVKVIDADHVYPYYDEWVEKVMPEELDNFVVGAEPQEGHIYILLKRSYHLEFTDEEVLLIQNEMTDRVYVIHKEGVVSVVPERV